MCYFCNLKYFQKKLLISISDNGQYSTCQTNPPADKNVNSGQNLKNNSFKRQKSNRMQAGSGVESTLSQREWHTASFLFFTIFWPRTGPCPCHVEAANALIGN